MSLRRPFSPDITINWPPMDIAPCVSCLVFGQYRVLFCEHKECKVGIYSWSMQDVLSASISIITIFLLGAMLVVVLLNIRACEEINESISCFVSTDNSLL